MSWISSPLAGFQVIIIGRFWVIPGVVRLAGMELRMSKTRERQVSFVYCRFKKLLNGPSRKPPVRRSGD